MILFRLLPTGFRRADLRRHLADLCGRDPQSLGPGAMTYQLRRLRLHGMIQRLPNTQRYRVTEPGFRAALFFTRAYNRLLRPVWPPRCPATAPHQPPSHNASPTSIPKSLPPSNNSHSPGNS
jgi:hypothetical protein